MALSGCGLSAALSPTPAPVETARAGTVPGSVSAMAARIQQEYAADNLAALSGRVSGFQTEPSLRGQLERWKSQNVDLRVSIVHSARVSPHRYVETLEFSADPRATPTYDIVDVRVAGGRATLDGTVSGIVGSTYSRARWSVTRSKHFVVYHSPYQLAGRDRAGLAGLEHQRAAFVREFGVTLPKLTAYYLYPTVALMDRMTRGMCGSTADNVGCTDPYAKPPTIQAAIWPSYHEPIHVYELAFAPPPKGRNVYVAPLFIGEGMAVALEDRDANPNLSDYCSNLQYAPLDACARFALRATQPMSLLSDRGFHHANPSDAYSLGGSFVRYLILRYGYHQFGKFYYRLAAQPSDTVADYNVASRSVYHMDIGHLIGAWTAAVQR